jgi:endogenous inhibitor of DNA gyrase (YacG/DUF329 family)
VGVRPWSGLPVGARPDLRVAPLWCSFGAVVDSEVPMSCPICSKASNASYRPFCSRRCADVDLARWLNGSYAVPSDEPVDPDEPAAQTTEPPRRH